MADKFNWDEYEEVDPKAVAEQPSAFKWDDYAEANKPEEMSTTGAFLRGAADMGTLGFRDEIVGGAKAAYDKLTGQLGDKDFSEAYTQYRDEVRDASKQAQEESPWAYGGGALVGGVASSLGGGLAARAAMGAGKLGLGAMAAAEGATLGVGASEADLVKTDDLGGALVDTGKEALTTGAMSLAGVKGMQALGKLAKGVGGLSPVQKFKSAFEEGLQGQSVFGKAAREAQGDRVMKLSDSLREGTEKVRNTIGEGIDDIWRKSEFHKQIDGKDAAVSLEAPAKKALESIRDVMHMPPEVKGNLAELISTVSHGGKELTAKQYRMLDQQLRNAIGSTKDATQRKILVEFRNDTLATAKDQLLIPDAQSSITQLNNKYRNIINAQDLVDAKDIDSKETIKQVSKLLKGSDKTGTDYATQRAYDEMFESLNVADPAYAKAIRPDVEKARKLSGLLKKTDYSPHGGKDLGAVDTAGAMIGNLAGLAVDTIVPKAARTVGNTVVNIGKNVAGAPPAALRQLATSASTKYPSIATALNEIANTPTTATVERASRLFALHQLPQWRQFLNSEERESK